MRVNCCGYGGNSTGVGEKKEGVSSFGLVGVIRPKKQRNTIRDGGKEGRCKVALGRRRVKKRMPKKITIVGTISGDLLK